MSIRERPDFIGPAPGCPSGAPDTLIMPVTARKMPS
jgi:hypothetical protein